MGAGIAQTAALAGYQVILRDLHMHLVKDGLSTIEKSLDKMIVRGQIEEQDKVRALENIYGTTDLSDLKEADLVIEAVVENMAVKKQIFTELDMLCRGDTILATNTSTLSITEIAATTQRTDKILGMHFFNPVSQSKLVEIIRGLETSDDTVARAQAFCTAIGKQSVLMNRESPGYIVNRILLPYINEAIFILGDNLADKESIDTAMKMGAGMAVGPLEMADKMGLDTLYDMIIDFNEEFRDSKYRPHTILALMIRGGYLGVKSGRGFYSYNCSPDK